MNPQSKLHGFHAQREKKLRPGFAVKVPSPARRLDRRRRRASRAELRPAHASKPKVTYLDESPQLALTSSASLEQARPPLEMAYSAATAAAGDELLRTTPGSREGVPPAWDEAPILCFFFLAKMIMYLFIALLLDKI
jgi:hypothetical protein